MSRKSRMWAVLMLATVLSLLSAGATMASSSTGATGNSGTAPAPGWVQLNAGQSQWYQFHTDAASSDATDKHILVELTADPPGSANFDVWTAEALRASQAGDTTATAVGNGTVQTHTDSNGNTTDLFNGDLLWASQSTASQDFFVGVQSTSSSPSRYLLKISGPYVSFPGTPAAASAAAPNSAQPGILLLPSTGQNAAKPAAGSGTDNPLQLDGQTRTLGVGAQQWYAFQHSGPDADGNETTASIVLNANPPGSATFSVWTAAELQALAAGDTSNDMPVANGSLHPMKDGDNTVDRFNGNLEWAGKFHETGTFYVQVVQTGNTPSTYSLQFSQQ